MTNRFSIIEICSNTFERVDKIFSTPDPTRSGEIIEPLLVENNAIPHVTLYAVKNRAPLQWEMVVDRNLCLSPKLKRNIFRKISCVEILLGELTIISVIKFNENKAVIRKLDLRPLGIMAWGEENFLTVGIETYEQNHMLDYPVAFDLSPSR